MTTGRRSVSVPSTMASREIEALVATKGATAQDNVEYDQTCCFDLWAT